jgi:hypothetical protein
VLCETDLEWMVRFGEELKFQSQMVAEMQEEKRKAEEENVSLHRDVELLKEKEKEYLKQVRELTVAA